MRDPHDVITSRLPRDELVGLLDTMGDLERQRITAPMPAVTPAEQDEPTNRKSRFATSEEIDDVLGTLTPCEPVDVVVRFASRTKRVPSWAIIMATCLFTLALAGLLIAAA